MTLDEILNEMDKDSIIDNTSLDSESLKIPKLQAKWLRILSQETRTLQTLKIELANVNLARKNYYLGKAPDQEYQENPLHLKILKTDVQDYLNADKQFSTINAKVEMQVLKISNIETFMKDISQRSFNIRNSIEYQKFKNGIV